MKDVKHSEINDMISVWVAHDYVAIINKDRSLHIGIRSFIDIILPYFKNHKYLTKDHLIKNGERCYENEINRRSVFIRDKNKESQISVYYPSVGKWVHYPVEVYNELFLNNKKEKTHE